MADVVTETVVLEGARVVVTVDAAGLMQWRGDREGRLLVCSDLIGLRSVGSSVQLYTFRMSESTKTCGKGLAGRKRRDVVMDFDTEAAAQLFCGSIRKILDESGRPKRLLVIVNPFGGDKSGRRVYRTSVEPLLKAAGISITMEETKYQRHGKDLAKSFDVTKFDGVVCVSGDGVLVEVLNGLLERPDWEVAIKMPIGIIPAGTLLAESFVTFAAFSRLKSGKPLAGILSRTGNGMAKSLLDHVGEPCDAASATFLVIRGQKQQLDVATAKQANVKFHSILMLAWGLVADVDFESEKFRWMGALRLDFYTLIRICNLRKYAGHIYYIPAPGYEGSGTPCSEDLEGTTCSEDLEGTTLLGSHEGESDRSSQKNGYSGPLYELAKSGQWRHMEGPFINIWLNNVPFVGESINSAPHAKFSDGYLDLIIMKHCPRWALLNLLLHVQTGEHIKSKYVEYLKVKAFRLDPAGRFGSDNQGGYIDLDGEILARGRDTVGDGSSDIMTYGPPVDITVNRGLATIFCPAS